MIDEYGHYKKQSDKLDNTISELQSNLTTRDPWGDPQVIRELDGLRRECTEETVERGPLEEATI